MQLKLRPNAKEEKYRNQEKHRLQGYKIRFNFACTNAVTMCKFLRPASLCVISTQNTILKTLKQ